MANHILCTILSNSLAFCCVILKKKKRNKYWDIPCTTRYPGTPHMFFKCLQGSYICVYPPPMSNAVASFPSCTAVVQRFQLFRCHPTLCRLALVKLVESTCSWCHLKVLLLFSISKYPTLNPGVPCMPGIP